MSLPRLTYTRYGELGGSCSKDEFDSSLRHAVAAVRDIIGFNVPDKDNAEAYERAVVAAVDVDVYYGSSGGVGESAASVTLGKFSASSGSGSGGVSAYQMDMSQAIRRELSGSGLLYGGFA